MSKAKLKKELKALPQEQVIDIVLQLYDASKEAKDWLEFYLEPNARDVLEKYKKAVYDQFYARNGMPKDPSFRECNKLITAFKKLVADPKAVADLMLYYVEQGCSLTIEFGDYDNPFYTALENNFEKAAKFISSNGLMPEYAERMQAIAESVEHCGWGLPDIFWQIFYDYGGDE